MKFYKHKRTYSIVDEDGNAYRVSEVDDMDNEDLDVQDDDVIENESAPENTLSDEEIMALKRLAGMADQLIELLNVEQKEHEAVSDEGEDIIEEDKDIVEDEDIIEEDKEELVDTDTISKNKDRKRNAKDSFGSLRRVNNYDSINDSSLEIERAWVKRYGGK